MTDLDRAIDFYVGKLGFELGFGARDGSSALLLYTYEETRWVLGLFRVDTVVHRRAAEYHPPSAPVQGPMNEPIVHGWMPAAAVFFRDPEGHLLELIAELTDAPRPEFLYRPLSEWRALRHA